MGFLCLFIFFNIIIGLSGLGLIAGAVYLTIETKFNFLIFLMIFIGIIIFLVFILGFKSKTLIPLTLHIILVIIIFLFFATLFVMLTFLMDKLKELLTEKIKDISNGTITIIEDNEILLSLITGIISLCLIIAIIIEILYYREIKNKDIDIDEIKQEDLLHGIDYSVMPDSRLD